MCIVTAPAGDGLELPLLEGGTAAAGEEALLLLLLLLLSYSAAGDGLNAGEPPAGEDEGDEAGAELGELLLLFVLLLLDVLLLAPAACRSHPVSYPAWHGKARYVLSQAKVSQGDRSAQDRLQHLSHPCSTKANAALPKLDYSLPSKFALCDCLPSSQ